MIQKWTINILLGKKNKTKKILAFPSFLQTVLLQSCVVLTPCQLKLLLLSLHVEWMKTTWVMLGIIADLEQVCVFSITYVLFTCLFNTDVCSVMCDYLFFFFALIKK